MTIGPFPDLAELEADYRTKWTAWEEAVAAAQPYVDALRAARIATSEAADRLLQARAAYDRILAAIAVTEDAP